MTDFDRSGYDEEFDDEDWDDPEEDHWEDDDESETIPCPFCKREIDEEALRCPFCDQYVEGLSKPTVNQPKWIVWTAILLLALFAVGYVAALF
ncbi:MAG: hypothetical protein ACE361_02910 [Aureliella sp.]